MRHEFFDTHSAQQRSARAKIFIDGPKRKLDFTVACLLGIFAIPIIFFFACISWMQGRPAFFAHERVGRGGRLFKCLKLRTMHPDSVALLEKHLRENPLAAREWAQNYKLRQDPRVSFLGRLLRQSSLDELPQLLNVIKGEMSLVGPRPVPIEELLEYGSASWAYLMMRPGLTGVWQISGRNALSYKERVRLDVQYVSQLSIRTDLKILLRTPFSVLQGTGL